MIKIPFKEWFVLAAMALALAFFVQFLKETPAYSAAVDSPSEAPLVQRHPGAIATAPQPPKLVPAVLGGKPVYVLYSTQPNDVILVRCYPTYQPSLEVKPMGGQLNQKEGSLTCKPGGAM
ncbi:hypothetical protein K9N68_00265 [Kovacikia minuta CCNUW1]|uniref:hypothetical protein n=1 Tax=Kovacikia minuta TaxID=2931930 RepID=UPI001CCC0ADC|nr:hypothetical protein [Kovacikia minuta]UBF26487.1 hypothetical protein K9N68_00265 [Kovacikia minuta CCNUW1]